MKQLIIKEIYKIDETECLSENIGVDFDSGSCVLGYSLKTLQQDQLASLIRGNNTDLVDVIFDIIKYRVRNSKMEFTNNEENINKIKEYLRKHL